MSVNLVMPDGGMISRTVEITTFLMVATCLLLCNGTEPVTATQGTLPVVGQTDADIRRSYATIQDSIIEAIRAIDQSIRGGE
jgi:hypothetical protein